MVLYSMFVTYFVKYFVKAGLACQQRKQSGSASDLSSRPPASSCPVQPGGQGLGSCPVSQRVLAVEWPVSQGLTDRCESKSRFIKGRFGDMGRIIS